MRIYTFKTLEGSRFTKGLRDVSIMRVFHVHQDEKVLKGYLTMTFLTALLLKILIYIAYIPLHRKPLALGPCVGLDPQRNDFTLPIPTCCYPKNNVSARPCGPNARPGGPIASQWNIICVGYARVGFALFIRFL